MRTDLETIGKLSFRTNFFSNGIDYVHLVLDMPSVSNGCVMGGEWNCPNPGQFIMMDIGDDFFLDRPLSVLDFSEGTMELLVQVKGRGTARIKELPLGSEMRIKGPYGKSIDLSLIKDICRQEGDYSNGKNIERRPRNQCTRIDLIAGGMGIVPIYHYLRILEDKSFFNPKSEMGLFFGGLSISYLEKLSDSIGLVDLCERIGVKLHNVPFDMGSETVLDRYIAQLDSSNAPHEIISCGPEPMLRKVQDLILSQDITGQLILERYMACGRGLCLACGVKFEQNGKKRQMLACREGPVFSISRGEKVLFQ